MTGFIGIRATFGAMRSIHDDNVLAITAIVDAREAVTDVHLDLDRALVDGSRRDNVTRAASGLAREADAWSRYYPATVRSAHECVLADLYISRRRSAVLVATRAGRLLDAGDLTLARSFDVAQTQDTIDKAAAAINELIRINESQPNAALALIAHLLIRAVTRPLNHARHLAMIIGGGQLNNAVHISGDDELPTTCCLRQRVWTPFRAWPPTVKDVTAGSPT